MCVCVCVCVYVCVCVCVCICVCVCVCVCVLFIEYDIFQSISSYTRSTNTRDLLFTPKQLKCISSFDVIAPVASSDHSAVLFIFFFYSNYAAHESFFKPKSLPIPSFKKCNLAFTERLLSVIGWHSLFVSCDSINDYWNALKFLCLNAIRLSTPITNPIVCRNVKLHLLRRAILKSDFYSVNIVILLIQMP